MTRTEGAEDVFQAEKTPEIFECMGWFSIFTDSTGAPLALWQPKMAKA